MSVEKRPTKKKRLNEDSCETESLNCSTEKSDINSNNEIYGRNDIENLTEDADPERNGHDSDKSLPINNSHKDGGQDDQEKVQIQFNNASGDNRCNHCREYFENPLMLLRHKRELHNFPKTLLPIEEIEKYYDYPNRNFCPICKKVIKTNNYRSIFLKHLHTHTVMLIFKCVICKKKFRRKDHMLNHQKRHVVPIEDYIGEKKAKK